MNWIDVNEDLPPANVPCLVLTKISSFYQDRHLIVEGAFSPSNGWQNHAIVLDVICWCCPKDFLLGEDFIKQLTSGQSQAACETQDDTQSNQTSCDLEDS